MVFIKKSKKKLILLIVVCILTFSIVCVSSVFISIELRYRIKEKKIAGIESEQSQSLYYFNQLTYKEQLLFKSVKSAADLYEKQTDILPYRFGESEFQRVIKAISFDCPELFYVNSDSFELFCDDYKTQIKMDFLASPDKIKEMKMEMEAVSAAAVAYTNDDQSEFEKSVILHDFLVKNCTHAGKIKSSLEIPETAHTAYGALINKLAFCDGYSAAYKILLNRCGIECIIVEGKTDVEPHLWNLVKQNNVYYHVDCTWNDPDVDFISDIFFHGYFDVSDSEIVKTHVMYDYFDLPSCDSSENYYSLINAKVSSPEDFEQTAYIQLKNAVSRNQTYFEIYPIYTNDESNYKDSLLNAIDRINSEFDSSVLSRSFRTFDATSDGYAVSVQIYYINQ